MDSSNPTLNEIADNLKTSKTKVKKMGYIDAKAPEEIK